MVPFAGITLNKHTSITELLKGDLTFHDSLEITNIIEYDTILF